ncbi:MAG: hypothetical protein SFV54_04750 [Bryobacteraceae bacterium]|nr:hypothetical protein [Bryobacteraceae bacterium]
MAAALAHPASLLALHQTARTISATGVSGFDAVAGGLPEGAITEVFGAPSSGRTSLGLGLLASATQQGKVCAWIDIDDRFSPAAAEESGTRLNNVVWVRCRGNAGHGFKAADLLLHGGGFGLIVMDLCDVPRRVLQAVPLSYWYRFRRAVESTPTSFLVLSAEPQARSTATLLVETRRAGARFAGKPRFELLRSMDVELTARKPVRAGNGSLVCSAA